MLFLRTTSLSFKSIARTIIFGEFIDDDICKAKRFVIEISKLSKVYDALVKILKHFKDDTNEDELQSLCSYKEKKYFWKKSKDIISFSCKNSDSDYEIHLDYPQFNEFLNALYFSIVPTLKLKNIEAEFLYYIAESEISDLVKLTNFEVFVTTFKGSKYQTHSSKLFVIYKFYNDIVFIMVKLKLFTNPKHLPSDLTPFLNM